MEVYVKMATFHSLINHIQFISSTYMMTMIAFEKQFSLPLSPQIEHYGNQYTS